MLRRTTSVLLVGSLSLSRLVGALVFASIAFQNVPLFLVSAVYGCAICSDLLDGYLARRLQADTYFGKIVDLVSDKSMTVVSLLYASARGIDLFPLALIGVREVIMIGARIIIVDGTQLLPTNKFLGGLMALVLWGNTLFLVFAKTDTALIRIANIIYWMSALVFALNLVGRIHASGRRIKATLTQNR